MKDINAIQQSVEEIFEGEFIVPHFQRPYSWDKEQCNKLWEDIESFFKDSSDEKGGYYYLGNLVLYPASQEERKKWEIIDGQQRLTTLLLLVKCLLDRVGAATDLEFVLQKAIYKLDRYTQKLTADLRLQSGVRTGAHGNDFDSLQAVMSNNASSLRKKNPFRANYEQLLSKLDSWLEGKGADDLKELILTLRTKVMLLPIVCADETDALTLFERINDRGKPLTDADILKANIYRAIPEAELHDFVNRWGAMTAPDADFRVYMYISRAKRKQDTEKEIALRSYMMQHHVGDSHQRELADNWSSLMSEIEAIDAAWNNYVCPKKWYEEGIHWAILETIPNVYWQYPAFVFQNKHGKFQDGEFSLAEERQGEYIALLENTVRYFFIKGVVHKSVNRVKEGVFKACKAIAQEGDYIDAFKSGVSPKELENFYSNVAESEYGRYQRGLVYVNSLQNAKQDRKAYSKLLAAVTKAGKRKCHIEHILPQKWAEYDGWDEKSHGEYVGKIGNLIPLEGRINSQAINTFFQARQKKYKASNVRDAFDLADSGTWKHWHSGDVDKRQNESLARLRKFFDAIKK